MSQPLLYKLDAPVFTQSRLPPPMYDTVGRTFMTGMRTVESSLRKSTRHPDTLMTEASLLKTITKGINSYHPQWNSREVSYMLRHGAGDAGAGDESGEAGADSDADTVVDGAADGGKHLYDLSLLGRQRSYSPTLAGEATDVEGGFATATGETSGGETAGSKAARAPLTPAAKAAIARDEETNSRAIQDYKLQNKAMYELISREHILKDDLLRHEYEYNIVKETWSSYHNSYFDMLDTIKKRPDAYTEKELDDMNSRVNEALRILNAQKQDVNDIKKQLAAAEKERVEGAKLLDTLSQHKAVVAYRKEREAAKERKAVKAARRARRKAEAEAEAEAAEKAEAEAAAAAKAERKARKAAEAEAAAAAEAAAPKPGKRKGIAGARVD